MRCIPRAGTSLLGAGYCLYSSSTLFVLTLGAGVWGFTYDSMVGEFVLSHPDIKIPESGMIYAFNEGNYMVRPASPKPWAWAIDKTCCSFEARWRSPVIARLRWRCK